MMRHFVAVAVSAVLIFGGAPDWVWGDDCSPIRLDQAGGAVEHVPEPVQYALSTCHSYAAAQLVDAYRFSHGDSDARHLTATLDVAIKTSIRSGKDSVEVGFVCDAIRAIQQNGSCDARPFDGSFARSFGEYPTNAQTETEHRKVLAELDGIRKRYRGAKTGVGREEAKLQMMIRLAELDPEGRFTAKDEASIVRAMEETVTSPEFYDQAVNSVCNDPRNRRKIPASGVSCQINGLSRDGTQAAQKLLKREGHLGWIRYLNARLERSTSASTASAQPVAVGMCYNVVRFDSNYQGIQIDPETGKASAQKSCLVHFPLVIGRRKEAGRCQYLLRNFRGESCNWPHAKPWQCEPGVGLWMDAEALARNIHSSYEIGTRDELLSGF